MPRGQYDRNRLSQPNSADEPAGLDQEAETPRPARADQTRRDRRRRDDGDLDRAARLKLAIPTEIQEKMDREGKTLRWIKNDPGRLLQMHADDWDAVEGVAPVAASRGEESQLILHAKYKDWYDDDQRVKADHLNEMESAVARGAKAGSDDSLPDTVRYAPKGNRISRGA